MQSNEMIVTMTMGDLERVLKQQREMIVEELESLVVDAMGQSDVLSGGDEIAHYLGISRDTLYSEINKGTFKGAIRKIGKKLIARKSDLIDSLK